jgi:hypothetical protein
MGTHTMSIRFGLKLSVTSAIFAIVHNYFFIDTVLTHSLLLHCIDLFECYSAHRFLFDIVLRHSLLVQC